MNNNPLKREPYGTHYQQYKMQPIELITACQWDFIQGNIAKYILRAKYKNGQQDIDKAIHYCELGMELTKNRNQIDNLAIIKLFAKINDISFPVEAILYAINGKDYELIEVQLSDKECVKKYFL